MPICFIGQTAIQLLLLVSSCGEDSGMEGDNPGHCSTICEAGHSFSALVSALQSRVFPRKSTNHTANLSSNL